MIWIGLCFVVFCVLSPGTLCALHDASGFWVMHDEHGRALAPLGFDYGNPDWVFGQHTFDCRDDGSLVCSRHEASGDVMGASSAGGDFHPFSVPFTVCTALLSAPQHNGVVALVGSATTPLTLVLIVQPHSAQPTVHVLRESRPRTLDPAWISVPVPISFPGGDGQLSHAYYYAPQNPSMPAGSTSPTERPPCLVLSHGGPTSACSPILDMGKQFFTSRGLAIVDVNYGGSSGYGRAYRKRLAGNWGVLDVQDCVAAAQHLAAQDLVDPKRLVIRGGSAGGYTTLQALASTAVFACGASHYGVSDLASLAQDTHKFESRYLDGLVGPYPEAGAVYAARSPLVHAQNVSCPVIFFQGLDDKVVPPSQAERMVAAIAAQGLPVAYLSFAGEGHGFRAAPTITAVARAELTFLGRVLGFQPAIAAGEAPADLVIQNAL